MSAWRKRIRRGCLITVLLVLSCAMAMAALSYPFQTTTTDSVRMRKSASGTSTVLDNLPAGASIEVLEKSGSFYLVKYDGQKGYVAEAYVNTDKDAIVQVTAEPMEVVSSYPYETVTRESVNLRESKSLRSTLLKKIPQGADISVLSNSGTWAEVEYKGVSGFVKNEYIVLKEVKRVRATATPSPVPSLSPEESAAQYQILQKGSEGADVKALQEALIELGYLKGKADGKFGVATENAVLLLQQANDYPTTGIMDANIQAFLYSGKPKGADGEARKVTVLSPAEGATMRLNATGDAVGDLQAQLKVMGYYTGDVTRTYDKATQQAVKAFQKKNGLTADGIAGAATQKAVFSASALAADETPTPESTATPTPEPTYTAPSTTVRRDSEGADAKAVQKRLKELGYYRGLTDGKFGAQSVLALKAFQKANGLEEDGVAGKGTYELLFSNQALKKGTTPTPLPEITPVPGDEESGIPSEASYETLRRGTLSADVAMMQQKLIDLGYLTGEPDGNYGSATERAVKAFQKKNQLTADGTAGSATLSLLYSTDALSVTAATPTPQPGTKAAATPTPAPADDGNLRKGSSGDAVKAMQEQLIRLGYLTGKADGVFGTRTYEALVAFQKANKLGVDGVAGSKTLKKLSSSSAVPAAGNNPAAAATAAPVKVATAITQAPSASRVQYANWYTTVKAVCKKYPYATVYDFASGISWQVHIFSVGAHADYEPLTASDTAKLERDFGGNTWNPQPVWVIFADGSIYMASTHSQPHSVQHITDNNFTGHSCLHFPRTQEQVEAIGPYATSQQNSIDAGWARTQAMK